MAGRTGCPRIPRTREGVVVVRGDAGREHVTLVSERRRRSYGGPLGYSRRGPFDVVGPIACSFVKNLEINGRECGHTS